MTRLSLLGAPHGAPPHGIVSPLVTADGLTLRAARWPLAPEIASRRSSAGTVVVMVGRTEFIEKYVEVVADLGVRGFDVVVFDWRGQGLSDRLLRDPRKGHVPDFSLYEDDVAAVVRQVLEPFCPRPWFALAHSMGGTVALSFAAKNPAVFQRMVLSAPMVGLARLRAAEAVRGLARVLRRGGLGTFYVLGGRGRAGMRYGFEGNLLTSDRDRYERTVALIHDEPRLAVGAPTVGWLHAAFEAMAALEKDAFVRAFRTPALTVMPGGDAVVDVRAAELLARRLRASEFVLVPGARHEILMERDSLRRQFWSAFDAFIPGHRGIRERVPAEA